MKFEVDTDTVLEKVLAKMTENFKANAEVKKLSEEEVEATLVLNKKKLAQDAQNIAVFFTGLYVSSPAENHEEAAE